MADDRRDDMLNGDGEDELSTIGSSGGATAARRSGGLAERLSEILLMEESDGDGDLLMQQSVRESNFLQWLQALDLQVIGACRADERLKPLLKINASSSDPAEDRLLAHLSQHFEAAEVGRLARCLCVPLLSMRVGKVDKQGSLFYPTSERGTLNLTLLPSSDLRLAFVGDNGQTERLAILSDISECSTVTVEEIPADPSGRSFLVKLHDGQASCFWCSEKSTLLGMDLLHKMKDLLKRKPTLAELTGISESRLECFASHLRAYLVGPTANNIQVCSTSASPVAPWADTNQATLGPGHCPSSVRPLLTRQSGGQSLKGHTHFQGSLSPKPGSFKEGLPRTLASLRGTSREKLRRLGDLHITAIDNTCVAEAVLNLPVKENTSEASGSCSASSFNVSESLPKGNVPPSSCPTSQLSPVSSLFSPYYCWCPPCASPPLSQGINFPLSTSDSFSLPPLSTLLPASVSPSLLAPIPPLDLANLPPLELPALLSDPLSRLPFSTQSSQSVPTFIPLMCDPIVHIPVVDVCSMGQGYLVSAGPGIATSIPPLYPKMVGPIMSEAESVLEKGARETLRLLIGGSTSQTSASLMGVLPAVLSNEDNRGVIVTGSRGLYTGISDVDVIVNGYTGIGLSSVSERSLRGSSSLQSCNSTAVSDVLEPTPCSRDLPSSTFMSMEDKED